MQRAARVRGSQRAGCETASRYHAGSRVRRGQPLGAEVLLAVPTAGRNPFRGTASCLLARARALSTLPRPTTQTSVTVTGLKSTKNEPTAQQTSQHRTPPHNAPQFAKGHSRKNGRGPNTRPRTPVAAVRVSSDNYSACARRARLKLSARPPAQTTPRSQRAKRPPPTGPHGGLEGGLHGAPGGWAPQAITGARAPRRLASTPAKATHPPTGPQEGGGSASHHGRSSSSQTRVNTRSSDSTPTR